MDDVKTFGAPAIRRPDGRMHAVSREAFDALVAGAVLVGPGATLSADEAATLRRCIWMACSEGEIEDEERGPLEAAIDRVTAR